MIVSPEIDAVTPESTWNTRLVPPPLTVTPAAGPVIVSVPLVSLSSSWPSDNVIVWAVAKTVGSKVIVWPGTALAAAIASRRLVVPLEKPKSSSVVLTTKLGAITVKVSAGLVTPASDAVIALVPGVTPEADTGVADRGHRRRRRRPVHQIGDVPGRAVGVGARGGELPGHALVQLRIAGGDRDRHQRDVRQVERGRDRDAAGRGRDGVTAGETVAYGGDARRAAGADGRRAARQDPPTPRSSAG